MSPRSVAHKLPHGPCRRLTFTCQSHSWTYSVRTECGRKIVRWACMGCDAVVEQSGSHL